MPIGTYVNCPHFLGYRICQLATLLLRETTSPSPHPLHFFLFLIPKLMQEKERPTYSSSPAAADVAGTMGGWIFSLSSLLPLL